MSGKIYTTGQVAKLLMVCAKTVTTWFDQKLFPGGYRLPGSRDRRIPRNSLAEFLKQNDMPSIEELEQHSGQKPEAGS